MKKIIATVMLVFLLISYLAGCDVYKDDFDFDGYTFSEIGVTFEKFQGNYKIVPKNYGEGQVLGGACFKSFDTLEQLKKDISFFTIIMPTNLPDFTQNYSGKAFRSYYTSIYHEAQVGYEICYDFENQFYLSNQETVFLSGQVSLFVISCYNSSYRFMFNHATVRNSQYIKVAKGGDIVSSNALSLNCPQASQIRVAVYQNQYYEILEYYFTINDFTYFISLRKSISDVPKEIYNHWFFEDSRL